jgi:hypothetical protein
MYISTMSVDQYALPWWTWRAKPDWGRITPVPQDYLGGIENFVAYRRLGDKKIEDRRCFPGIIDKDNMASHNNRRIDVET